MRPKRTALPPCIDALSGLLNRIARFGNADFPTLFSWRLMLPVSGGQLFLLRESICCCIEDN